MRKHWAISAPHFTPLLSLGPPLLFRSASCGHATIGLVVMGTWNPKMTKYLSEAKRLEA